MSEFNFMESENFQQKLRAFLPKGKEGDDALKSLMDFFKSRRRMKEVGTKVAEGSMTAFRTRTNELLRPPARDPGFVQNVVTGNLGEAASNVVRKKIADTVGGGVPPETSERIAELLFARGGTEQLYRFLQEQDFDQNRIEKIMALTRQFPPSVGAGMTAAGWNPGSELMQSLSGMTTGY